MGSFRPITDTWILARPKVAYYGAYPSGFLERARALLGVALYEPVLHVCGGRVRDYPFRGVGPNDLTVDADPELQPDFLLDIRQEPLPLGPWRAILADPPYSAEDASNYRVGAALFPELGLVGKRCWEQLAPGGRYGVLHYQWARPPAPDARQVAVVSVLQGWGNRARVFTVYERVLG